MSVAPMELQGMGAVRHSDRLRGLLAGFGYALTLTLLLAVSLAIQDHVNQLPFLGIGEWLSRVSVNFRGYAISLVPPLPLLIITLNLAPRRTVVRAAWLIAPVFAMAMWSVYYEGPDEHGALWIAFFIERLFAAALMAAVCLYHSSRLSAAGARMRSQIESATLDSELERARLQLMRSQTEPHFLFNTLANIRTLARMDRDAAVEMLDNLMRYLSAALPQLRRDDTTLAEEMQLVDAYLSIYRVRMGTRLSYEVEMAPDLGGVRVPTMMLLTLVENALKHGINPAVAGGFVRVSANRSGATLVLKVADSGRGITESLSYGTGTGLATVRLRLTTQYGAAASLTLAHAEPRGVIATISLPFGSDAWVP